MFKKTLIPPEEIVMVTEGVIIQASFLTGLWAALNGIGVSFSQSLPVDPIEILLSITAFLIGCLCWFMKQMRDDSRKGLAEIKKDKKEQHALLFAQLGDVADRIAHIEGEHEHSMRVRECAYAPEELKTLITEGITKAFKEGHISVTFEDCPHYSQEEGSDM